MPLPYAEAQATSALPLVRRIVRDLIVRYGAWQDAVSAFEYATVGSLADQPDAEAERLQRLAQTIAIEVEALFCELDHLGVECRDPGRGLVAFPGAGGATYYWAPGNASVWSEASANGTSNSAPSRAQDVAANTSLASRSKSDGSRE